MKRFIACLLVLVLLLPAAALADEDLLVSADNQQHDKIKILGRNCYATGEGNDQRIWVFYELYNAGGNPIHMSCDDSNIQFLDANGQEDADASRRVEIKFRLTDEEMLTELQAIIEESQSQLAQLGADVPETSAENGQT